MICAVDPGTKQSAMLLFNPSTQTIESLGIHDNRDLIKMFRFMPPRISVFTIELIASFGFTVGQEIFDTCLWIGKFTQAVEEHNVTLYPCYRRQVLSHFHATNDASIRKAMIERFGVETVAGCKYDLWSALAIAAYTSDKIASGAEPQPLFKVVREVKVT